MQKTPDTTDEWLVRVRQTNKDNKNNNYINNFTRNLSGGGNVCKIISKICDGRKMSAEKILVNAIGNNFQLVVQADEPNLMRQNIW